ncbi:MAG: hypothetical protein ABWY06_07780 [Pseudomonas sp.]|uniref:hypothetical protein n=1 Tax=Pseudomonas sp. TaxID=306 RepID=UPI0033949E11
MPAALFNAFLQGKDDLAFSCAKGIPRADLVVEIQRRMANPTIIAQGNAPLCGPAAFMFNVAKTQPYAYARYVLDLLSKGEAMLGNLSVKPSAACREAAIGAKITVIDWVALASLRDSSNSVLAMNGPGSAAAGITMAGAMVEWFDKTGLYASAGSQINYVFGSSAENLIDASRYYEMGNMVCLLIRAAILGEVSGEVPMNKIGRGTPKTIVGTPDHWVVLQTPINIGGRCWSPSAYSSDAFEESKLEFSCYSWGGVYKGNGRISNISVERFLPYFYGFVHVHPKDA